MIKKYLEFIKESQLSLFSEDEGRIVEKSLEERSYRLDDEKIEESLIELKDGGYIITIERGFVEEKVYYNYNRPNTTDSVFSQKLVRGNVTPAYWIYIMDSKVPKNSNDDLTDSLLTSIDYLEDQGYEVEVKDDDSNLEIDKIEIKGGFFIKDDSGDNTLDLQIENNIGLFVKDKKEVVVSTEEFGNYYGWLSEKNKDTFIEDNSIYITIELSDLADLLLNSNDNYKGQLLNGIDSDYYYSSEYEPDIQSLISYELDKDNIKLLTKSLIIENGGLVNFLEVINNDDLNDLNEEEVIDFIINERFHSILSKACKNSEITNEVRQICGDFSSQAHQESNYKELISDFDDIVGDSTRYAELNYKKYDKEVELTKTHKDGTKYTYSEVQTFYKIMFEDKWIEDFDYDFLSDYSLYDIFREYSSSSIGTFNLSPNFSDWGDVDSKELNSEIKYLLDNFIQKNPS